MLSIDFYPPVIAHRGANAIAPENTLSAFKQAKELGANWIEFDVMLAACGEAVVIHDETLDRTTDGTGRVCDFPYSYLQTLDAGLWFGMEYTGEKIPTLKETLLLMKELELSANIEIKALPGQEEAISKKVLEDIKQYWTQDLTPPLISSFSVPALRCVRKLSSTAHLALLIDEWFANWETVCHELDCVAVNLNYHLLTQEVAEKIKAMDKFLLCYTVNDVSRALDLMAWGVDAVFTDEVEEMVLGLF